MLNLNMQVVFVEPEDERNLGFLARVMKNFSFKKLVLVNPKCNIGEDALRISVHAKDILQNVRIVRSFDEAVKGTYVIGTSGKKRKSRKDFSPENLTKALKNKNISVVFGRESIGLKKEELEKCDVIVRINTSEEYPIMNITHAAAIILYEIYKVREKLSGENLNREIEIMEKTYKSLLSKLDYSDKERSKMQVILHDIFSRPLFSREELMHLVGFFRRIEEKLKR